MVKPVLIFFIIILIIKSSINASYDFEIETNTLLKNEVGKRGAVIFYLKNELFSDDMNRKAIYKKNIVYETNINYEIWCGIWIDGHIFFLFCEFDENFPKGQYFFQFNDNFIYKGNEINLHSNEIFTITKLDSDIIDLYSPRQTINVTDDKDTYELKFNIVSYNQERLYIEIIWDEPLDCKRNNKELICQIKKNILVGKYISENDKSLEIPVKYLNKDGNFEKLYFILYIIVNINVQKKDIYVKITKLLSYYVENFIAYETNVTNIPSIYSNGFKLDFYNDESEMKYQCIFKSGVNGPLLLICQPKQDGILSLKEIKNDYIIKDINVQYNFIIKPVNINEKMTIIDTKFRSFIISIYPSILDFTSKDIVYIDLLINDDEDDLCTKISFNEDEEDLYCEKLNSIKRCKVPKKHFKGKKNGYYYITYFDQKVNKRFTSFLTNPVSVILTNNDNSDNSENQSNTILIISIVVLVLVVILLIGIVIYIFIFRKKNKDLNGEVLNNSFKEKEMNNIS